MEKDAPITSLPIYLLFSFHFTFYWNVMVFSVEISPVQITLNHFVSSAINFHNFFYKQYVQSIVDALSKSDYWFNRFSNFLFEVMYSLFLFYSSWSIDPHVHVLTYIYKTHVLMFRMNFCKCLTWNDKHFLWRFKQLVECSWFKVICRCNIIIHMLKIR